MLHTDNLSVENVLSLIQELYRRRVSWHKAEKGLILQTKAICRRICGGDKDEGNALYARLSRLHDADVAEILMGAPTDHDQEIIVGVAEIHPLLTARAVIDRERSLVEVEMEKIVRRLPITGWIETIDGVSYLSLAAVIGSAGDLHRYPTVQSLWKRMGLAVMPNGRQRAMRDAEQAKLHGYSPMRRAIMWNIGASILRSQSRRNEKVEDPETGKKVKTEVVTKPAGPWREIYDNRRAYETAKNEAGDYAEQATLRLAEAQFGKTTEAYKAYSKGKLPPLHLHMRAQRYLEKMWLKQLWIEWRRVMPKPLLVDQEEQRAA